MGRQGRPDDRVTIVDVARAAGVSKGAVSLALNGRPGVSDDTRVRVREVADRLGWFPNGVARALSGARAGAIGWAIVRSSKSQTIDPYFVELFSGIELELADTDLSLVVKLVSDRSEEIALYRRWAAERRVDGVLVNDSDVDDERYAVLETLGLPLASFWTVLDDDSGPEGVPSVWANEARSVRTLLDRAYSAGHRRIAWVSGSADKRAPRLREQACAAWQAGTDASVVTEYTDFGPEQGNAATERLLRSAEPPTFLIFDNDIMAMSGLALCRDLGLDVPRDLSVVSFIDSTLCAVALPQITALRHDIVQFGRLLTRRLLDVIDGTGASGVLLPDARLVERMSVGPAPARPVVVGAPAGVQALP